MEICIADSPVRAAKEPLLSGDCEINSAVDPLTLPICARGTAICAARRLNVRTAPTTDAQIVGQFVEGQRMTVWAIDNGWLIVQSDEGLTGWCAAEWVIIEGSLTP